MNAPFTSQTSIKTIGSNGQISLGKHFAGRQVLVEEQEPGVWLVRTATVVPDNEAWLQDLKAKSDLETGLAWAVANPPDDSNVDEVLARLNAEA